MDSSTLPNVEAIRQGEDAIALMHVSGAEAMILAKLTGSARGSDASTAADLHRYIAGFAKTGVRTSSIHPGIMAAVAEAIKL